MKIISITRKNDPETREELASVTAMLVAGENFQQLFFTVEDCYGVKEENITPVVFLEGETEEELALSLDKQLAIYILNKFPRPKQIQAFARKSWVKELHFTHIDPVHGMGTGTVELP